MENSTATLNEEKAGTIVERDQAEAMRLQKTVGTLNLAGLVGIYDFINALRRTADLTQCRWVCK